MDIVVRSQSLTHVTKPLHREMHYSPDSCECNQGAVAEASEECKPTQYGMPMSTGLHIHCLWSTTWMFGLTLVHEDTGSLLKLQTMHGLHCLRHRSDWGYRMSEQEKSQVKSLQLVPDTLCLNLRNSNRCCLSVSYRMVIISSPKLQHSKVSLPRGGRVKLLLHSHALTTSTLYPSWPYFIELCIVHYS